MGWNITARITTMTTRITKDLARDLELDRGEAIVGQPWTADDLCKYVQDHKNHVYCWTDNLAASKHASADNRSNPLNDGYTGFEGQEWCKYRVCVGLRYGRETDGEGVTRFTTKTIDHMVVDTSEGADAAYRYCCMALTELVDRWASTRKGKLICRVNSKDTKWLTMFAIAGFHPCETQGDEIVMELIGGGE